jgi:hypothetical protein
VPFIGREGHFVSRRARRRRYPKPRVSGPRIEALAPGDPELRFVAAMCLYSRDVDAGEIPGPFTSSAAGLYARCVLLPDQEFERHARERDGELAKRFRVPIEQVGAKRFDLAPG